MTEYQKFLSSIDLEAKEGVLREKHSRNKKKVKTLIKTKPTNKRGLATNFNTRKLLKKVDY